jgi:hypothetical protein
MPAGDLPREAGARYCFLASSFIVRDLDPHHRGLPAALLSFRSPAQLFAETLLIALPGMNAPASAQGALLNTPRSRSVGDSAHECSTCRRA